MNAKLFIAPCCLLMIGAAWQPASAQLTSYGTRVSWLAAVGPVVLTEDFESDVAGFPPIADPYTTAKGFQLNGVVNPITMQILPAGTSTVLANGTQFLHFRDFTAGLLVTLPSSASAFGFDYGASEAGWTLTAANGVSFAFPSGPGSSGFIGFNDPSNLFTSFTLTGLSGAQGGLSIDNISVPVPEPSTFYMMGAALLVLLGISRRRKTGA